MGFAITLIALAALRYALTNTQPMWEVPLKNQFAFFALLGMIWRVWVFWGSDWF
jgi:hypothetical protein